MKVGLAFAASIAWERENSLELIKTAETAGFESVWCGEHVILPDTIISKYPYTDDGKIPATADTAIPDPLIWLAFAAAASSTLRLGTCILIVPQRNPLVLAKELATLDRISGGRV
jgi:alkanesulfonate monooxygenase SsuD/methylene tetrahydromethanopterin reductase-like flavin-dependent oxidoreductase (luciferase family)